jgi:hypothetical protein
MSTPEFVVTVGLRALEQGKSFVIPGWQNYLTSLLPRLLPRRVVAAIAKRMFTPSKKGAALAGAESGRK